MTDDNSKNIPDKSSNAPIHIYSEVEPLKKVLLFRPGHELDNLMPEYL